VRRREFITLAGGAAIAWPLVARAQRPTMPVIGFLRSTSLAVSTPMVTGFRQGLTAAGLTEGQNFATGSDPVVDGLVASLNRPGGNVTGVSFLGGLLGPKRLEMLRQLVPTAATIAILVGTDTLEARIERRDVELAAQALGQQLIVAPVASEGELDGAFTSIVERGAKALLVGAGPLLASNRERIVALAARHAIPAIYSLREYVEAGGLMSYGASLVEAYRQAGIYAGRILKGEKPADLPVMQSTKFELVINLKATKALGLSMPPTLLAVADEMIE
jgi:putative ABC transport system substrate-binding protein